MIMAPNQQNVTFLPLLLVLASPTDVCNYFLKINSYQYPILCSIQAYEQETLENIRGEMVADMRDKGVNEKYLAEMLTLNIKKMLSN